MVFKYVVHCWVHPRSGFDLVKKNRVMELFRSVMEDAFDEDDEVERAVKKFEKSHEGLVLERICMESDTEIIDIQKEVLPVIQKEYPDATIFSCDLIAEPVSTEGC
jgi:serine phosphatase RsbU (regulator of sigma subunit)